MAMIGTSRRRNRAPLVTDETELALKRRGSEAVGLGLIGLGVVLWMMLWSYSPLDPSIFTATDLPPQNMLGLVGSYLADPLHRALGWAAFGLPLAVGVWGLRLVFHRGESRAVSRAMLVPVALAVASAFAAAHVPPSSWGYSYGLGGLFGDAVLGGLLDATPLPLNVALKIITLALAAAFLTVSAFALGVDGKELSAAVRFLGSGTVVTVAAATVGAAQTSRFVGGKTLAGVRAARELRREQAARAKDRKARAEQFRRAKMENRLNPNIGPDGTVLDWAEEDQTEERASENSNDERVMARIADAVRRREERPKYSIDVDSVVIPPPPTDVGADTDRPEPRLTADDLEELEAPQAPPAPATPAPRVQHPEPKRTKSRDARREEQPSFSFDGSEVPAYDAPALSLLTSPSVIQRHVLSDEALEENARMLETVLDDYGVKGEIVAVRPGPVVTMYELEPAAGLKASRVIGLADDIARSMSALAARVSTIPGRSVIGIELPNETREMVLLREILSAKAFGDTAQTLPLALGKDISGEPVVANLARMPHLLIAGTTGSGKSVAINTMILSLLYRLGPEECRLIMIDPKMLELSVYDGIPHLLSPVVTDPKKAVVALKWTVAEMEERYRKMSKMGVRNISGYNSRVAEALKTKEGFSRTIQTGFDDETGEPVFETESYAPEAMPYIVVVVDEMADLMMVAGKEIEACIQRLAQMARASGIHLIMATQRPSVDVITGTIKANFPTRISFQVTSKVDSRTILGEMGAEQLLGQGDMLYMAGGGRITRVHGPFVSDEEVEEIVSHLKTLGTPEYVSGVVEGPGEESETEIDLVLGLAGGNGSAEDALYDQALAVVARDRKCSTSYVQRKLGIGYNKAAKLVERMEEDGVVSQANHVGKREVLVPEV